LASTDCQEGIKLKDFVKMWTSDGTKLMEEARRRHKDSLWLLYAVYFHGSTYEYGRHMAIVLKVNPKTDVILKHDLTNLSGEVYTSYRQGVDEWFEKHIGRF